MRWSRRTFASLDEMPPGTVVGTSSLRREAALRTRYPHLVIKPLRGNLDTRLRKLDAGEFGAIILAAAGLKRLGIGERIRALIEPEASLPAAGQGALGIEIRSDRPELAAWLAPLNHTPTLLAVSAERAVSPGWAVAARCRWAPMPAGVATPCNSTPSWPCQTAAATYVPTRPGRWTR